MSVHNLTLDNVSDDALMSRLFELAQTGDDASAELEQLDAAVYARLMQAYGDTAEVAAGEHVAAEHHGEQKHDADDLEHEKARTRLRASW